MDLSYGSEYDPFRRQVRDFLDAHKDHAVHAGIGAGEALEELRDRLARSTDPAEIQRLAVALQEQAYREVPYINFGQWVLPTAYSKSLRGVIVSPVPFFWNIEKAQ